MTSEYKAAGERVRIALFELLEALVAAQNLDYYTALLVSQDGGKTTLKLHRDVYKDDVLIGETTEVEGRLTRGNP